MKKITLEFFLTLITPTHSKKIYVELVLKEKKSFYLRKSKKIFFSNKSVVNTFGSNFTIFTIFDSEELIDEYVNHKLDFDMAFGVFC